VRAAEERGGGAVEVRAAGALVGDALVEEAGGGARVGEGAEHGKAGRVAEVEVRNGVRGRGVPGQDCLRAARGAWGGGHHHGCRGGEGRRDLGGGRTGSGRVRRRG
jgi:hypothetical protein